jgi:hypothetical protein
MKIKAKGTDKIKEINPVEWSIIEENGNSPEYEVIERNTVWAAPINNNGELVESKKKEFESSHWNLMLDLGHKNKWRRLDLINLKENKVESNVNTSIELEKEPKDKNLEISELQVELTKAQIEKTNAETHFTIEKTKDLKRKIWYFIGGIIVGNISTILKLIQSTDLWKSISN